MIVLFTWLSAKAEHSWGIEERMNDMTILATTNTAWGFWGTIAHHADPAAAWPIGMQAIAFRRAHPANRDFGRGRAVDDLDDRPASFPRDWHPTRAALPRRLRHGQ